MMGDITLRKALDDYKTVYMPYRNFAERTRVEYLNDLEDMILSLERLGVKELEGIGLPQLERYLADLENRGIAGSTRKRKVISIRSFLTFLYQDQYINVNLAKRLIPPFVENKTPRFLTKAEYECLLEASASNLRDFTLIQLLLQTGIKLSELTRLTINDLELPSPSGLYNEESGYLHISGGERQKERILPLNYKACQALDRHLKTRTSMATSVLFVNRFGLPFRPRGVEKLVRKYLDAAEIRNANVHTLRHTFGVHHAAKGTSVKTIGETMGHKNHRSTLIYVSLAQELMRNELHDHAL